MAQFYSKISEASKIQAVRYYFAYGMNTNIREMTHRCPDAVCVGAAKIKNYRLVFRTHADIERSENNVICGVLWKITARCENSLDLLEGYPYYYDKRDFIVEVDKPIEGMTNFVAMAYQMVDQNFYSPPSQHYVDCLVDGYVNNGVNVDQIYWALEESNNEDKIL